MCAHGVHSDRLYTQTATPIGTAGFLLSGNFAKPALFRSPFFVAALQDAEAVSSLQENGNMSHADVFIQYSTPKSAAFRFPATEEHLSAKPVFFNGNSFAMRKCTDFDEFHHTCSVPPEKLHSFIPF